MQVFVSCERIDQEYPQKLITFLRTHGFGVFTSPRNPLDGSDQKWSHWYEKGLIEEVSQCQVFVSVVTDSWDSSTWMGQESSLAESLLNSGTIKGMYFIDLRTNARVTRGMRRYLKKWLSSKFGEILIAIQNVEESAQSIRAIPSRNLLQDFIYGNQEPLIVDVYYNDEGHPKRLHDQVGGTKASEIFLEALHKAIKESCHPEYLWRAVGYGFAVPHSNSNSPDFLLTVEGIPHQITKKTISIGVLDR